MPLPNRVAPDGTLFATPARGLMMGNRGGCFHDRATHQVTGRPWASRQWITCALTFKGRDRSDPAGPKGGIWGFGYTELFFCDEVTALSAGHRPCMECRRADALAYRAALVAGLGLAGEPSFPAIDRMLDGERRDGRAKRVVALPAASLPDGAMFRADDGFFAIRQGRALRWSPDGYAASQPLPDAAVAVLTPPATVAALTKGYRPLWHPTT